jgi:hypothetical protein
MQMEIFKLEQDLELFCVTARSFPHDIKNAFDQLVKLIGETEGRTFFGISYQAGSNSIIYKAAVQESYKGEGVKLGCEPFTLKQGEYITETISNWMEDINSIGATFLKLGDSRPDTTFPCVEWYKGPDVMCMVRLDKAKNYKSGFPHGK